jgi:hypothetical protein
MQKQNQIPDKFPSEIFREDRMGFLQKFSGKTDLYVSPRNFAKQNIRGLESKPRLK